MDDDANEQLIRSMTEPEHDRPGEQRWFERVGGAWVELRRHPFPGRKPPAKRGPPRKPVALKPIHERAIELFDGKRSCRSVGDEVGLCASAVWKLWSAHGLRGDTGAGRPSARTRN